MRYFAFILLVILGFSFKVTDPCLLEVKAVFDKLNTMPASPKEASYLHYTVIATLTDKNANGAASTNKSDFEMYASSRQNRVYSKEMILLKDQQATYAILPSRKMIYVSDAVKGKKDESLYDKLKVLQDTIFRNAENVECTTEQGKVHNKIVAITLNKKMSEYIDIKKVCYYINTTDNTLKRVYVEYLNNKKFSSLDYIFNKTEFNITRVDMTKPVQTLVFGSNNQLLSDYKAFKVIDNRKK